MIYFPNYLHDVILSAPVGSTVRGTYNVQEHAGSLVSVDTGNPTAFVQAAIGRIDECDSGLPLAIMRKDDSIIIRDGQNCIIETCAFNASAYYERNPFDPDVMSIINNRRVLIIGEGSVGSVLTAALAQAGVGEIVGADPDYLEIHNCMRHQLSTEFIGWNKAIAMAEWLKTSCPNNHFVPVTQDLFSGDRRSLKDLLDKFKPHLIAAVTDSKGVQNLSQMAAMYCDATFFTIGCFNNAIEGEIFIRLPEYPIPAEDDLVGYACYEELHPPGRGERSSTQYDYSTDMPGRYAGEPALGHLINHKVYIASTILMDTLLFNAPVNVRSSKTTHRHLSRGAQYIRIGGPYVTDGIKALGLNTPWQMKWGRIKRHNDCNVCGDGVDITSILFPTCSEDIEIADDWV